MSRLTRDRDHGPEPLLDVRAALILALALAAGVVVGVLTWWAAASLPVAVLAGLTTAGGAGGVLNDLIGGGR